MGSRCGLNTSCCFCPFFAIVDVLVIVFVTVIDLAVEYDKDCMPRLQLSCRCGLRKLLTAARKFVKSVVWGGGAVNITRKYAPCKGTWEESNGLKWIGIHRIAFKI